MKPRDFIIDINKVHVFKAHSILILLEGQGLFQIDFRNYNFTAGKALFIAPGQYFQFLGGQLVIKLIELPVDKVSQTSNSRYLFRHLVSLGYVDLTGEKQFYLDPLRHLDVSGSSPEILHSAIEHWMRQNPFNASRDEVNLLFDLKEIVDEKYREPLSLPLISKTLHEKTYRIQAITREKLKTTVNKLINRKLLLEAQRKIVFTGQTTKEIAYQLGFNDPTYFNRFFKQYTNRTPHQFRDEYDIAERDTFIRDLTCLIDAHFKEQHTVQFYADAFCMTPKAFSRKVNEKVGATFSKLIKERILTEAKGMLQKGIPVKEIAFALGFDEPNHFSTFFKNITGVTPTLFGGCRGMKV